MGGKGEKTMLLLCIHPRLWRTLLSLLLMDLVVVPSQVHESQPPGFWTRLAVRHYLWLELGCECHVAQFEFSMSLVNIHDHMRAGGRLLNMSVPCPCVSSVHCGKITMS